MDETQYQQLLERVREARPQEDRLRRFQPVSDDLLLAALDRAERHSYHYRDGRRGAWLGDLKAHLAFRHDGASTRGLRPQLDALIEQGAIRALRRGSRPVFEVTTEGRRRVARARRAGTVALPESPQHQVWRRARARAAGRIEPAGVALRATLATATAMLDADQASAADWRKVRERLFWDCGRLASVVYCLREWPEPSDEHHDTAGDTELARP